MNRGFEVHILRGVLRRSGLLPHPRPCRLSSLSTQRWRGLPIARPARWDRRTLAYRTRRVGRSEARLRSLVAVPTVPLLVNVRLHIHPCPDPAMESTQIVEGIPTSWHKHDHPVTNLRQKMIANFRWSSLRIADGTAIWSLLLIFTETCDIATSKSIHSAWNFDGLLGETQVSRRLR